MELSDNKLLAIFWVSAFTTVILISFKLINMSIAYKEKITSIERYIIEIKLLDGSKKFHLIDMENKE